ncbi:MAG: hypothetical protein ABI758_02875 [Candidatus Woesebacteria bacterium]
MKKRLTFKQLLFEQQILGILLFSVLVVFLWVVSTIYFSYTKSTLTSEDETVVIPLSPIIDDRPLQVLSSRRWWSDSDLQSFAVSVVIRDSNGKTTTSQTQTGAASPSATLAPTPVPTPLPASGSAQTQ